MTKRNTIDFLEYLLLGLCIWGAFAAFISQEYSYAIFPLTLAIALNVANQQRLRSLQRRQENSIGQLGQPNPQLSLTQQQVEQLRNQEKQDIEAINSRLKQLESFRIEISKTQQTQQNTVNAINLRLSTLR